MKNKSIDYSRLRRAAEKRMHSQVDPPEEISVEDAKSLIHELRVHQIELEMQNEELRQAHAQIEESRERYADLYDFAPVGYLALDDKGHVVEANLAAAAQLGTERARLIETIFPLYVNSKDRQQARLHIMTVFKTRGRQTCELRLKPKGGEEFYARLESVFIEDANGEGRCRTSISDISYAKRTEKALHRAHDELEERVKERTAELTEANERLRQEIDNRKHAEESLRDSEERFRLFVQEVQDYAIFMVDPEGCVASWNTGAEQIKGYTPDEIIGHHIACFYTPEDNEKELPLQLLKRAASEGRTEDEGWRVRKDGSRFWADVVVTALHDKEGSLRGFSKVTRDITERQQLLEKIESLARFPDENPNPILRVSSDGKLLYASKSSALLLKSLGCKPGETLPGDWLQHALQTLSSGRSKEMELTCEEVIYSLLLVPVSDLGYLNIYGRDITERKRAEVLLQRQAELLHLSYDAIIVWRLGGRIESWNKGAEELYGYPGEEAVGRVTHDLLKTSHAEPWPQIEAKLRERKFWEGELKHRTREGQEVIVSARHQLVCGVDGVERVLETNRDITKRKRVEEELRKSHDELELRVQERTAELVRASEDLQKQAALLDLAHDAMYVVDSADVVSFWNKGAEDLYGYTREQAIGKVAYELIQTRFPESLEQVVKEAIDKGHWAGELTHTTSTGKELVVESRWALRQGEDGEPTGFLEVNRDITSRKIIEEKFRKADRAFRTLSECNQAMVRQTEEMELLQQVCRIVVDVGGYRMAWVGFAENDENKTVLPIASAGYDQGYLDHAKITWADTERGRGPTGTAIRTGKIVASQNAFSNPAYQPWRSEGTTRGYASSIALPLIVERNVIGTLTIYASEPDAFDEGESSLLGNLAENLAYGVASIRVAEQRRLSEEDLRVYASRLELINKELQDFAFVAAHDLQEPLRKIQTFCDMAQKRCAPVLDSTSKDYLDRVIKSASRMRQLLSDLLDFSKVATRLEAFKKIDLVKIVREAADVFEASVKETGCQIEIENIPAIEADETQMLGLFQNLIGNALKFRGDETPRIKIYGKLDKKRMCEIFVKDNGIGFDPRFAELIFKPFQRLHGRSKYDGTGMGLAICRKIVERHGGSIRAESEPGKGSTFIIRLPAKQTALENIIAGKQS
ncbi:MAG: PAS domain S-box protein [Syntrophobacteraceae bacterium]